MQLLNDSKYTLKIHANFQDETFLYYLMDYQPYNLKKFLE